MKHLYLLFAVILFVGVNAYAQTNNLVVFSEHGGEFFLYVNGVKQNSDPLGNVKVTNLNQPNVSVKVVFKNAQLPNVSQNVFFANPNTEYTYAVLNKKNDWKIRYRSEALIASAAETPAEQTIVYKNVETPIETVTTTTVTTVTTDTIVNNNTVINNTVTNNPNGQNLNVGMNVDGNSVNMNVTVTENGINMNVNDGLGNVNNSQVQTSTSTTTTTVTTNSNVPNNANGVIVDNNQNDNNESVVVNKCDLPMDQYEFEEAKNSIKSKSFEDSKLKIAEQITENNCLLTSQVKAIMQEFSFEDTRLKFAKFAYGKTYDKNNYYKLNDAFTFESSIDDLDSYIKSKK